MTGMLTLGRVLLKHRLSIQQGPSNNLGRQVEDVIGGVGMFPEGCQGERTLIASESTTKPLGANTLGWGERADTARKSPRTAYFVY